MKTIKDILSNEGIQLMNDIRANLGSAGMVVTQKTSHSLAFEIKEEGTKIKFLLYGRPYFMTVQTGRGPTKEGAPTSDPPLIDAIKEWVEAKGITANPWAVAKSIHEKGTKLWRDGGRKDIVDPAIETFIKSVEKHLLDMAETNLVAKVNEMKW